MVVDVTVRYDGSAGWLESARKEKADKYSPYLGILSVEFPLVTDVTSHGFVMGVRGKCLRSNNRIMEKLGMSKRGSTRFAKVCSRTTVLKSVDFQSFNKAVRGKVIPTDV